jgi:16S rRNA (cytosine967-C5)-methyltransferase
MKNYNGRWNHVYKLWESALSQESLPQFDRWLSNEFAKNSKYGSQDRRWYSDTLFAAIRHGYYALFCLFQEKNSASKNVIEKFEKQYQTPNDIFQGFKSANTESFFKYILKRINNENIVIKHSEFNLKEKLIYFSIPLWLLPELQNRFQFSAFGLEQIEHFFSLLDSRPPLWIRPNHTKHKHEILDELQKENYKVEEYLNAIQVTGSKGIFNLKTYQKGMFEIQDFASQQIGQHIQAHPKQYVWDCCAGGGGKTLQIASMLDNKGVIYASDIREYKLEEVKKRAKRAGFFNIRCLTWQGTELPAFQKEILNKGGFDWVLVDAPCSSTGTWRRNPDAKYKIDKMNLENLTQLQLSILTSASQAVISGGHLVYSTCSWLVNENENIVSKFLAQNPHFTLQQQNLLGSPKENSDTMFAAVLKKI